MADTEASIIDTYPPNVNKFPNFYKCKEYLYILYPGDMLYIPKNWFHWVFSYPDITTKFNQNIAISFPITKFGNKLCNEFKNEVPFVSKLNDNEYPNISYEILKKFNNPYEYKFFKSKKNVLTPCIKPGFNNKIIVDEVASFKKLEHLLKKNDYNIYVGQNGNIMDKNNSLNINPNKKMLDGFPESKFGCFLWFGSILSKDNYIDSGLHYDYSHNCLIQIKGIKIVRLYHPNDYDNLYIKPLMFRRKF
jgi:hypothetical protein